MTIVQVADLHRSLVDHLASGKTLVIDGSRVEEIDTAVLQLLASLLRGCTERGIGCSWHGASEPLLRAARLIGLDRLLQFPDAVSAAGSAHAAV